MYSPLIIKIGKKHNLIVDRVNLTQAQNGMSHSPLDKKIHHPKKL